VTATLDRYDVLNVESPAEEMTTVPGQGNLSGTRIRASRPVAVFSGNLCAVMPHDAETFCCCDHVEEQLMPLAAWGRRFVVARGPVRRTGPDPEVEHYRITAGNVPPGLGAITLTYHPSQPPGAPSQLAEGESVEFASATEFAVEADGPVLVMSYLVSCFETAPEIDTVALDMIPCTTDAECQGLPYSAVCNLDWAACLPLGDPSMTMIPPVEQFRDSYVFLAPIDYETDTITVIAPLSAEVLLDGAPLSGLAPVATLEGVEYGVLRQEIGDGTHRLSTQGGAEVGLLVFGVDEAVSYGYPAGLDLETINPLM
jgi:hypothetical protein